jgi:ferritin-like metal-binding protein YciE
MKLDSLKKLYLEELRDLYSAETQLVKALPKMVKGASSAKLQQAFGNHLEQTKEHVERLNEIFDRLDEKPTGKTCKAMKGLIEEGSEMLEEEGDESVIDAGLIGAAQRVEHYEIASYGTVRTFANLLGEEDAAELLQQTLDEEGETDKELSELAEGIVNEEALTEDGEEKEAATMSSRRR